MGSLTLKNTAIAVIASLFFLQIISMILTSFFPSIPLYKGGPVLLIILLFVGIVSLFVLSINLEALKRKENLIFVILVFSLVILGYIFLPKYYPQLFSLSPDIARTVGQIFTGGLG
jgi:hypothetical protein